MIDILLINPQHPEVKYLKLKGNEIPLSLGYLASFLKKYKFKVEILDLNFYKNKKNKIIKSINELQPKYVGLTGNTIDIDGIEEISKIIKKNSPKIKIIVGGPHVSSLPEKTLKDIPEIDYIICGEGEITLKEVIQGNSIEKIKGLAYRTKNKIILNSGQKLIENLDSIPFPARDKLKLKKYIPLTGNYKKLPSTALITSRGVLIIVHFVIKQCLGTQ